jgi:hypothetical protein
MLINLTATNITGVKRGNYDRLDLRHATNNGAKNAWMRYWLSPKGGHYVTRKDSRGNVYIISAEDVNAAEQNVQRTAGTWCEFCKANTANDYMGACAVCHRRR